MDGYPQDLPGVMKLLNKYIVGSGKNRNFRKISGKERTVVAFNQTREGGVKDKKKSNSKGEYHFFLYIMKYNWAKECPNLEEEQREQLHTNVGTVKDDADKKFNTTGVSLFKNHQNTNTRKTLDLKKVYFDICSAYNQPVEENNATKIHQAKSALYGECSKGVSVIKKKGKLVTLYNCINPDGISKIFSIPRIYKSVYRNTYGTKEEWVIYTPEGGNSDFKRNSVE